MVRKFAMIIKWYSGEGFRHKEVQWVLWSEPCIGACRVELRMQPRSPLSTSEDGFRRVPRFEDSHLLISGHRFFVVALTTEEVRDNCGSQ